MRNFIKISENLMWMFDKPNLKQCKTCRFMPNKLCDARLRGLIVGAADLSGDCSAYRFSLIKKIKRIIFSRKEKRMLVKFNFTTFEAAKAFKNLSLALQKAAVEIGTYKRTYKSRKKKG